MKEIREIIYAYDRAQIENKRSALATVVQVEGSSYRRAGARMLVTDDGMITGAISGGCLEGDALRKALLAIHQNKNKLVTYDTSEEGDTLGVHLGCNGVVHILFEPLDPSMPGALEVLRQINSSREPVAVLTLFTYNQKADQIGTIGWINQRDGQLGSEIQSNKPELLTSARKALQENISHVEQVTIHESMVQLSVQVIHPSIRLVIFGAGNDAIPLAAMAELLGWSVTVIDGRPAYANKKRFSSADQIIVSKPSPAAADLGIDANTAIILMSHNYNYDLAALKELVKKDCRYIGILGPRKKYEKLCTDLEKEGVTLAPAQRKKIYAPVGLEIGAETSEEIALSITAEVKAVLSGKKVISLKDKRGPIHERSGDNLAETIHNEK